MPKSQSKKEVKNTQLKVSIEKLVTKYEIKFDFNPRLTNFIKNLPKSHREAKVINHVGPDGKKVSVWSWVIKEVEFGKLINFLVDNLYEIKFENLSDNEINYLRYEYIERQKRINDALRLKTESLEYEKEDFSFMKIQPYNYQKKAVKFFDINNGISILGDSPGVGKTMSSMTYAVKHKLKTLVICPASLKLTWKDEIEKFSNEKAFVFKYNPPKKSKNKNNSKEDSLFHIINYESTRSYIKFEYKHKCSGFKLGKKCGMELIDLEKDYKKCPSCYSSGTVKSKPCGLVFFEDEQGNFLEPEDYDLIIMDECHRIKNPETGWTKLIISAFRDVVPKKILMSGTLIKNKPKEIFPIVNFVDPKNWDSFHDFAIKYCGGYKSNFGWDYDGASNLEELYTKLSPIFLRRLKKDVLTELPPKTYTNIYVELTPEERRKYEKLKEGLSIEQIESGIEKGEDVVNHLVTFQNLKKFISDIKLEKSYEIIQDIVDSGEKIVVFSQYIDTANKVKKYFDGESVLFTGEMNMDEKRDSVKTFQENKNIKVFAGTIMAAGVGITLTAASELIFIDSAWTIADMEQAEDRIHRASSTANKIHIMKLIVKDSVDEDIELMLENKRKTVSKVLDNALLKKEVKELSIEDFKSEKK